MKTTRGRPPTSGRYSTRKQLIASIRQMRRRGRSLAAIAEHCRVSMPTIIRILSAPARQFWTEAELAVLRARYPHEKTEKLAAAMGREEKQLYCKAKSLGLRKSAAYLASPDAFRFRRDYHAGWEHRFKKGQAPPNKGLRRPGWGPGRMKQTQFKKGQWPVNKDPEFYVLGALRVNSDGYIDIRIDFPRPKTPTRKGSSGWRALHLELWEDAHGPVPPGHIVVFKNRDKLDVELDNLEMITLAENMRRNTVHNLPKPLANTVQLLRALRRKINGKQRQQHQHDDAGDGAGPSGHDRGPARGTVRDDARLTRGHGQARGREGDRRSRPGDRQLGQGRG